MYETMRKLSTSGFFLTCLLMGCSAEGFDWCNHKCEGTYPWMPATEHTMCIYPEGGGPECREYHRGLTTEEKQFILDYHNEVRQKVANGLEERGLGGPQPSAANMMRLVWDSEVEMIAQRWADQCQHPPHDDCIQTMDGESGGQNAGGSNGYGMKVNRLQTIKSIMKGWSDEAKALEIVDVDSVFTASTGMVGHYTQVVWAETTRIGCGMSLMQGYNFDCRLICNYKPSGNVQSLPIYKRGVPASQCPAACFPSTKYPGLCESAHKGDLVSSSEAQTLPATPLQAPSPAVFPPVTPSSYSPPLSTPIQQPSAPTQTTTQPAQEKKKPSLLWRMVTLPWRILKWFFSIPIKVYEFIKDKLFT